MIAMLRISMLPTPNRALSGRGLQRRKPFRRRSVGAHPSDELRQLDLGASAETADYFGSAQTADLAADGKRQGAGQPVKKAAGVEVAGPGGVDNTRDGRGH